MVLNKRKGEFSSL